MLYPSELPSGKGWSLMDWQIKKKKNNVLLTLFKENDKINSGVIYEQIFIECNEGELNEKLKYKQKKHYN